MSVRIVNCSIYTAPSSPGRKSSCSNLSEDFYFSEPTSPTHFLTHFLQSSVCDSDAVNPTVLEEYGNEYPNISQGIKALDSGGDHVTSFEFEFSSRYSEMAGDQPFAEELFLNGQIRPLNEQTVKSEDPPLSSGSNITPLNAPADEDAFHVVHGASKSTNYPTKIGKGRSNSLRSFLLEKSVNEDRIHKGMKDTQGKMKFESQRYQASGRGSKRWRLKDFLDRSSGERKRGKDIPPAKQAQKHTMKPTACTRYDHEKQTILESPGGGNIYSKSNGIYSTHALHYKAKKAEAHQSRRKSFLPYTRGLLGCLMNGLARNLHPFSSM